MNIFSDKAFVPEDIPHGPLLFPFWGFRPAFGDPTLDAHRVARVAEKVAEFHERLSDQEFRDRQRACRQLWLDWLSPLGFFKNFRRYFD